MKNLFIIISLLFLSGCKKESNPEEKKLKVEKVEKYSEIVDNKSVYKVINSALSNNEKKNILKHCDAVLDRKTTVFINYDSIFISKFDTLFSENDKKFILKQYRNGNRFILDQKLIPNKKVIEINIEKLPTKEMEADFWERIKKENNCVGFVYVPLFNLKKDLAIVECGISGKRGIFIYKLDENQKWKLYKTVERVVE